jgi:cell division protein FtsL
MAKQTSIAVSDPDNFVAFTELASAETCASCIYLQSQFSKVTEELKSLQTIISLLQKEDGWSSTELNQLERRNTVLSTARENQLQSAGYENGQNRECDYTQKWKCI